MKVPPAPPEFAKLKLDLAIVGVGSRYGRIFLGAYPNPLGFGKAPSRFGDPRRRKPDNRFGVLYLGSTLKVCFVEAILRVQGDGLMDDIILEEDELRRRNYVEIEVAAPLTLVDLREDGALRMRNP